MLRRSPAQERILKVLWENRDQSYLVENPISLCAKTLTEVEEENIAPLLNKLQARGAIRIFKSGVASGNGGVIFRIKVLKNELYNSKKFSTW
ncbi:MAG: hypothetical protein ABID67_02595 [Candidatus Nealsonbacteria bacterium]